MGFSTVSTVVHPSDGLIEKHMSDGSIRKSPGSLNNRGYMRTWMGGRPMYVHRLVWEHVNGPIPEGLEVDHINGVKHDNRIVNLRLVTRGQNLQNQHHCHSRNRAGVKGVTLEPSTGNWTAHIRVNGQRYYLGYFTTIEDAQRAYAGAAALLHTHNPHAAP